MSVKFWEMKFDGTEYIDNNGFIWELDGTKKNFFADVGMGISMLTIHYTQKQLIEITFEEYVVLSDGELTILKNIDKKYKFIARDYDILDTKEGRLSKVMNFELEMTYDKEKGRRKWIMKN